jgi:CBS domain-containing protein
MEDKSNGHVKVGRVCSTRGLIAVEATDTLLQAAERMVYKRVGALAVLDKGALVGLISEADLVCAIVEQVPPATTPVRDYMTEAPITVLATDDPSLAARYMLEHEIGHLVVMESGLPIGMVSRSDLLGAGAVPVSI